MPVTSSPVWGAPQAGLIGDAAATAGSAQVNQLLTTHPDTVIYQGNSILTPVGTGNTGTVHQLSTEDIDQPFTLSGTAIGRVDIPVYPVGNGADLLVSLCADNSGAPGTVITQTRIPASWITQLSAVAGAAAPSSSYPTLAASNNPLAVAQFNPYRAGAPNIASYAYPAISAGGVAASAISAYYDTGAGTAYTYLVGGTSSGAALANVFSVAGDSSGVISASTPQPTFPQNTDGSGKAAVCTEPNGGTTSLIVAGGSPTFGGTPNGSVYISTIDTSTGNLGAWSSQTAFPANVQNQVMVAYNGYVYVIGGWSAPAGSTYNTAYYAQVQNAQISSWNTTTPFPTPISLAYASVIGGRLIVAGGSTSSANTFTTATYYAEINADGALGPWIPGPTLPVATENANGYAPSGGFGMILPGYVGNASSIGFGIDGPGQYWVGLNFHYGSSAVWYASSQGGITQQLCALDYVGPISITQLFSVVPAISVPLPATGLTNSGTYHVLMQQVGGDLTDYLVLWDDVDVYTGNPTLLTSTHGAYTWTAGAGGHAVPLQIFDQAAPAAPGIQPVHTWADNGARITTLVHATTPDQRLLGLCEATRIGLALNQNQGFESGISPWTVSGGTVTQSSAQFYEGQYAAQITPSGTAATVYLQSEMLPCMPGQSITANAQMWFTNAVTSNASASINWYTLTGTYISTSSNNISVAAATWTNLVNTFTAPAGAYQYTIDCALSGTPAAAQVFYIDAAYATNLVTPQQSTVTALEYPGVWPGQTWPPLGATVLA
jgi:hypothetical protein